MPNPGKIKMYTSGCPKNQNRCWYKIGSPPPLGSKKVVLKFRSVSSIVIAPANTGSLSSKSTVVINTDHTNKGICSSFIAYGCMFKMVVIKLIEPKILEMPARWRLKIAKSTEAPLWAKFLANGGYTVQPVPTPLSIIDELSRKKRDGGKSQNLILFIRGKAISGADSISGINQFPNPPIIAGITIKKIITKACAVTIEL